MTDRGNSQYARNIPDNFQNSSMSAQPLNPPTVPKQSIKISTPPPRPPKPQNLTTTSTQMSRPIQQTQALPPLQPRNQTTTRRRPPPPGSAIQITSLSSSLTQQSQAQPISSIQSIQQQQLQPSPIAQSIQSTTTQISPVTLAAPRPETERLPNEYVDTPFRSTPLASRLHHGVHSTHTTHAPIHQTVNTQSNRTADHRTINSADKINATSPTTTTTATTTTTPNNNPSIVNSFGGRIQNSIGHQTAAITPIISSAQHQQLNDGKCHQKTVGKHLLLNPGTDIFRCTDIPAVIRSNSR